VYYRRVWHPAIPTQPSTTEIKKQEGVRIAERKAAWVQRRGRRRGYSREEGGVGTAEKKAAWVWQDAIPS
jgi:hypothetical protein